MALQGMNCGKERRFIGHWRLLPAPQLYSIGPAGGHEVDTKWSWSNFSGIVDMSTRLQARRPKIQRPLKATGQCVIPFEGVLGSR